jgi:hypothetical protein
VKPTTQKVQLDAKEYKAEVRLGYSTVEDNIEQGSFVDTVRGMLADAIARDMEELLIQGDTASTDIYLATMNGILKQATSNVVDLGVITPQKSHWKNALTTLPNQFLRNKKEMRIYTSTDADIQYRDTLADRGTVGGDRFTFEDVPAVYAGVPIVGVPLFPDNLNAGGGSNETAAVFTHPKNIHVGIWRQIRIEMDRDISAGQIKIVASWRWDMKYDHEPAVVKVIKIKTQ